MQFHTDPGDWAVFVEVEDAAGGYGFNSSPTSTEVLTLRAITVDNAIAYGNVGTNSDTGAFNPGTTVVNEGNEAIDIEIAGTDMTDGAVSVIGVANQLFSTSTFTYGSCAFCSTLQITNTALEVDLAKPLSDSPAVEDEVYWGIFVPLGTNSAAHTGVNTFYAVGD